MTLNLNELKQLAEEATPGPWNADGHLVLLNKDEHSGYIADCLSEDQNAAFIAAANPSTILALIVEIERLNEENVTIVRNGSEIFENQKNLIDEQYAKLQEAETRNALQQRALDEMRATNAANADGKYAYQAHQYRQMQSLVAEHGFTSMADAITCAIRHKSTANGAGGAA